MPLAELLQTPDVLLELEPEELAGELLADLVELGGRHQIDRLHRANYLNHIPRTVPRRDEVLRAITEAWVWLEHEGLIAPDPAQAGPEWIFVTRRGHRLREREDFRRYREANRLPRAQLHPAIADRVWPTFLRGAYDTAVFEAFREVEIAVRAAARLGADEIGVDLMRRAFHSQNGLLADQTAPAGEREALAHLFAGAIGSYKNPQSHRAVNLDDPGEAAEIIVFASQLLRIVDRRQPV